jgi:hypothetical protein
MYRELEQSGTLNQTPLDAQDQTSDAAPHPAATGPALRPGVGEREEWAFLPNAADHER